MTEISMNIDKFKGICKEAIPVIKKLQEIAEKNDVRQGIGLYIGKDGYFRMDGSGFDGWELSNCGGETTIKHEYREVLKLEGEDDADNQ